MDTRIPPIRPDIVGIESAPRPTPTPVRVHFSEVLSLGASGLVRGAETAMATLPGGPVMAVALRGGPQLGVGVGVGVGGGAGFGMTNAAGGVTVAPEGPGVGTGNSGVGTGGGAGDIGSSLQQAQEMNIFYLQLQEAVNAQNRQFTALSNVLKTAHDTVKNAIGNLH